MTHCTEVIAAKCFVRFLFHTTKFSVKQKYLLFFLLSKDKGLTLILEILLIIRIKFVIYKSRALSFGDHLKNIKILF
jgi:membrane protein CcdC involved in cytochrome C biogenesis